MLQTKLKVLIADDAKLNREMLKDILAGEYDILEAANGLEAIGILEQKYEDISFVLLDLVMPKLDGFEVLQFLNKRGWITNLPVAIISSDVTAEYINKAYDLGASDYIGRPYNDTIVRRRVKNLIKLSAREKRLVDVATNALFEKDKSSKIMINILSHIVEFRNGDSGSHVKNINGITEILLRHLKTLTNKYKLDDETIDIITMASSLHDIGKIGIPESILNKPSKLDEDEFMLIKSHSEIGAEMLQSIKEYQDEKLVKIAEDICLYHHEKYDGNGYPRGLRGDEIPICAQVVSVADCYDALTSDRCYKKAYTHEQAIKMIINGECGEFNPILKQCLIECSEDIKRKSDAKTDLGRENFMNSLAKLF